MKAKELIDKLLRCPPDMDVVHEGSEWELDIEGVVVGRRYKTDPEKIHLCSDAIYALPEGRIING